MNPLRLVLVTRRFWPLVGSAEKVTANLAVELSARGCPVTVLTARWRPNWPANIRFHEVPVVRLPHAPQRAWSTVRYMRGLARWLTRNQHRYDLVYVSMLKHEAYAALRAVGGRVPVALRAEGAGRFGDCLWQINTACGRRIKNRCMKAAAFIGPSRAIERELQAAGYPRDRIHYLPNGVPIPPPRNPTAKADARAVLAEASAALETPDWAPVAVYTGRLQRDKRLKGLIAAWKPVVARWPGARLWLAGDGPARPALQRQIESFELTGRVEAAGAFDGVDELLAAADLFVAPAPAPTVSMSVLEAMAAGLPIVASDTPGHRAVISDGRHGLLVRAEDSAALSAAIIRLLEEPDLAARLGAAARRRAAAEFSLANMADEHLTLFKHVIHLEPSTTAAVPNNQDNR